LGYITVPREAAAKSTSDGDRSVGDLSALFSRALMLMAFALEFERSSDLSMAIHGDVLRVISGEGVPLRDLPR
jgi:hypothetical protein